MSTPAVSSTSNIILSQHFLNLDKTRHIVPIFAWILEYFDKHPQQNLAQFEQALRTHNCFTHLIAALPNNDDFEYIWLDSEKSTRRYYLLLSAGNRDDVSEKRNVIAGTAQENLAKLADCGFKIEKRPASIQKTNKLKIFDLTIIIFPNGQIKMERIALWWGNNHLKLYY